MSKVRQACLLGSLVCSPAGCIATDSHSDSQVSETRIIAMIASPPEVLPGGLVHLRALVASPDPTITPNLSWSFCRTPRAAGDNTAVSAACAEQAELPIPGNQSELDTTVPSDACKLFGSETSAGAAPTRADSSGGYYQPVRAALDDTHVAVLRQRIRCDLPNASLDASRAYNEGYVLNRAPIIAQVRLFVGQLEIDPAAIPTHAELRARVELADGARESYLFYDPRVGSLQTKQEVLSTSWFTTSGSFEDAMLSLEQSTSDNTLSPAPDTTTATIWIVARDDRGGVAYSSLALRWL